MSRHERDKERERRENAERLRERQRREEQAAEERKFEERLREFERQEKCGARHATGACAWLDTRARFEGARRGVGGEKCAPLRLVVAGQRRE